MINLIFKAIEYSVFFDSQVYKPSVFSLPSLRPLLDVNYLPLTDMRIARTFCFSNQGQALYLTSPTEIQRITYSQETYDNLQVTLYFIIPANLLHFGKIFILTLKYFDIYSEVLIFAGDAWRAVYSSGDTRGSKPRLLQGLIWRRGSVLRQRGPV